MGSLPREWAHALSAPEAGCLLIARPGVLFQSRSPLNQGVVLLLANDDTGAVGLSLNVPTEHSMRALLDNDCEEGVSEAFGDRPIRFGGASEAHGGPRRVYMLTDEKLAEEITDEMTGTNRIIDGLFSTSPQSTWPLVRDGRLDPSKCEFFAGHWYWEPGQLTAEVEAGAWMMAACSTAAYRRLLDMDAVVVSVFCDLPRLTATYCDLLRLTATSCAGI